MTIEFQHHYDEMNNYIRKHGDKLKNISDIYNFMCAIYDDKIAQHNFMTMHLDPAIRLIVEKLDGQAFVSLKNDVWPTLCKAGFFYRCDMILHRTAESAQNRPKGWMKPSVHERGYVSDEPMNYHTHPKKTWHRATDHDKDWNPHER